MNLLTKISSVLSIGAVLALTLMFGLTSSASADCIYQYNANGFNTSSTPVFNSICGVPNIGDEANFVRIRADVNGNDEDNANNPAYSIGTINSSCSNGDKFDVWNYVHNNASQDFNPDVGSGSAVAKNTFINMQAPINTTNTKFSFNATVGASNANPSSVTNMTPAVLDCNGNNVQLTLVPGSVNEYSEYGQSLGSWTNLTQNEGALNTNLPLGSTNVGPSSANTGNMWGCFNYRIVVVYQVVVTPVPVVQTPPVCTSITANDQADVKDVSYTANSATVTGFNINLFGGTNTSGSAITSSGNLGLNGLPYQFDSKFITPGNQYTIVATVLSNLGNVTSKDCTFTFTSPTTPTPPTTPPSQVTTVATTTLPNTGPGSVVAIFVGVTAIATGLYYWLLRRRIANK